MANEKNITEEVGELFNNPEPWEKWETKLVLGSITIAIIGLLILAILINWLIL